MAQIKFQRGQVVYGLNLRNWSIVEGEIEDHVWEPKERSYSVRTPLWQRKKWWGESELYTTRDEAKAALDAIPDED